MPPAKKHRTSATSSQARGTRTTRATRATRATEAAAEAEAEAEAAAAAVEPEEDAREDAAEAVEAVPETAEAETATDDGPTIPDAALLQGNEFAQLAKKHWLTGSKRTATVKVKNDVLKSGIWDVLDKNGFSYRLLVQLETLQLLEEYLWPGFDDNASDTHVLLILLMVGVKKRERLDAWRLFNERPADFAVLFRNTLALSVNSELSLTVRTHILSFFIHAFQSLDTALVRRECAPLVSIAIWHNLAESSRRDQLLDQANHLRKSWRAAGRRYDAADDATKARLRFDRSWLYSIVLDFFGVLYGEPAQPDAVIYCERLLEFLSDLQSQLPTRRYVNALLQDLHLLPALTLSPLYTDEDNSLLRDMAGLLTHYTYFCVHDQTGAELADTAAYDQHCARLAALQRLALQHFKDKLMVLALSNFGAIGHRDELAALLDPLDDAELADLARRLHMRTAFPPTCRLQADRKLLLEALLATFQRRSTFREAARALAIVPTEEHLFEDRSLARTDGYDGSRPLALPKLNLQYLSVGDFLWRSLVLYRCEAFYGIRQDIEAALQRVKPDLGRAGETIFTGASRMAMPIQKPSIIQVVPPLVGETKPSLVKAEISMDFRGVREHIRREWEDLRPDDTVFLVAVNVVPRRRPGIGAPADSRTVSAAQKLGIQAIRTAEVMFGLSGGGAAQENGNGRGGRGGRGGGGGGRGGDRGGYGSGGFRRGFVRRLQLRLDPVAFMEDSSRSVKGEADVYETINLVVRRRGRENNFKPVLDSIRSLVLSEVPLAPWLHEVFLGYGDPAGATYKHMRNRIKRVDFHDTFLDWHHLIESLPGKIVEPDEAMTGSFGPPYVLELPEEPAAAAAAAAVPAAKKSASKKRRRDAEEPARLPEVETVKVATYKPANNGPYPVDAPKRNAVRFTAAQTEAIMSGTQRGLTVIVGPPGTGKTDVATQIIHLLYHNFPQQRTLLIAHSNQALNQLFAKIVALDIDERHLLRLGHGEEELDTDGNFSKYGRVDMFLENRNRYLAEVTRLAASMGAPGAHGQSAETAGYFNAVYVEPAWAKFQEAVRAAGADADEGEGAGKHANAPAVAADVIAAHFPFHAFFADAPQPLFPADADGTAALEIAEGCYRHITRIFSELADVLPFEILRRDRDKANYLLTAEARIVAMTSTHAAMRRGEIAGLGFHYDNVVMEEAAQITEIESFIPLAMQNKVSTERANSAGGSGGGEAEAEATAHSGLQRVVLCGDHLQNSPIVQNLAFRHYANLEQSLFARLVRLGVPPVRLDQQGRARPSIADLYRWRYRPGAEGAGEAAGPTAPAGLSDLPHVQASAEFMTANAGFRYDYQFIDVPDYKGRGEAEPTPHFIQNLGEAEYAVALFQYMRLLDYPADRISILATYAGQRALIRDVLDFRCRRNPIFGMPKAVTTVDKYQGEQNDYIILSLTRTERVGFMRDIRRLTVALSRARLGLYVLGRRSVFATCAELRDGLRLLLQRPAKLTLVTGELWPSKRPAGHAASVAGQGPSQGQGSIEAGHNGDGDAKDGEKEGEEGARAKGKGKGKKTAKKAATNKTTAKEDGKKKASSTAAPPDGDDDAAATAQARADDDGGAVLGEAVMEGVEHLGQYVYEMTQTKIRQLQEQAAAAAAVDSAAPSEAPDKGNRAAVLSLLGAPLEVVGEEDEDRVALPDDEDKEEAADEGEAEAEAADDVDDQKEPEEAVEQKDAEEEA